MKKHVLFLLSFFICIFLLQHQSYSQFPYNESFKGATAPSVRFGGGAPGEGLAFLTADPAHGIDPVGSGYLRLTNNSKYQKGYVYNDEVEIPSGNGLQIDLEYFVYGGTGADGISFFLFDASVPTFNIGGFGGSLGYAQYQNSELNPAVHLPGVSGGYIGIGLDEFGYFARTNEGRQPLLNGTPVYPVQRGSVAIRGKGNGDALVPSNYPLLAYQKTESLSPSFKLVGPNLQRYPDSTNTGYRRVNIVMKRHPVIGFNISVDIITGGTPTVRHQVISEFHYAEEAPERLAYGIASSTGNSTNFHEIRNLRIALLNDNPLGSSDAGETLSGQAVNINVTNNDQSAGNGVIIIQNTAPANGSIIIAEETGGIINYTPNPGFSGIDRFTYRLYDPASDKTSSPITVTMNVRPVGSPDSETTPINTPVNLNVKANDLSQVGTQVIISTDPGNGSVVVDPATYQVRYTPNNNFSGADNFVYYLQTADGLRSDPINATVVVTPAPPEPVDIGLAKALIGIEKQIDGSFLLNYRFIMVNPGNIAVDNLSLQDDLSQTFAGLTFSVKSLLGSGSLIVNGAYNGSTDKELLSAGNILPARSKQQLDLQVIVKPSETQNTYYNTALVSGRSTIDGSIVEDISTDGLSPDPITAGDYGSSELTPVVLQSESIFIPGGFSPNNDGINDFFTIENSAGRTINLEVYNRWGNAVYKSKNYQNDWAGKCTEGIHLGEDIPPGTYYYIIKYENQKKAGYITVNR